MLAPVFDMLAGVAPVESGNRRLFDERGIPAVPDYGLSFTYDASLDLRPPDAILSIDCVR